jgi:hypothetical protein
MSLICPLCAVRINEQLLRACNADKHLSITLSPCTKDLHSRYMCFVQVWARTVLVCHGQSGRILSYAYGRTLEIHEIDREGSSIQASM